MTECTLDCFCQVSSWALCYPGRLNSLCFPHHANSSTYTTNMSQTQHTQSLSLQTDLQSHRNNVLNKYVAYLDKAVAKVPYSIHFCSTLCIAHTKLPSTVVILTTCFEMPNACQLSRYCTILTKCSRFWNFWSPRRPINSLLN